MVCRISEEWSKTKRGIEIKTHENWFGGSSTFDLNIKQFGISMVSSRLAKMIVPKLCTLLSNFAIWECRNSLAASIALEKLGWSFILWELESSEFSWDIDQWVFVFDAPSDIAMACLNYLLEHWVALNFEFISWIERIKLWHKFVQEVLSCLFFWSLGSWREDDSSCTWVLQGLVKRILIVFLAEGD